MVPTKTRLFRSKTTVFGKFLRKCFKTSAVQLENSEKSMFLKEKSTPTTPTTF